MSVFDSFTMDDHKFVETTNVREQHHPSDEALLARFGKNQALKRRFGFWSLFGFSCAILITWETTLTFFQEAFANGGPAGILWGFLIAWLSSLSVYICLAEMASLCPIAGGQYFWTSILAPKGCQRFLSYITGWLTVIAWIAVVASGIISSGTLLQGLIILNYPGYVTHQWQDVLYGWAILAVAIFVNVVVASSLPFIEGCVLAVHVMGFIAVLIPLIYLSPHGTASDVFFRSLNEGNWSSQGISYCVGFIGNVVTFVGADAAVHMSEEIEDAAKNVPRAIFTTVLLNGTAGFAMLIALLFCLGDIDLVINTKTGYPFVQVFADSAGVAGATAMVSPVIAVLVFAVTGFVATASRMTWSFARDKGLPFHAQITKVHLKSQIPLVSIVVVTVIPCLLTLVYIGSVTAYDGILSITVSGLYGSYFIPCACLLWRRTTGQIAPYDSDEPDPRTHGSEESSVNAIAHPRLQWGPWHLPRVLGIINNAFACVYCVFVLFWDFWPPQTPTDAVTMNYSVLVTGATLVFSVIWYYVRGKKEYIGPLVEESSLEAHRA